MKRPTKNLSDVDIRGRVRRGPQPEPPRMVKARFLDGPLAGTVQEVPKGADYVTIGPWKYSFSGKADDRWPTYCKHPKSRREVKLLLFLIGKQGHDPRVQTAQHRSKPVTRTAPPAKGRGARRRAEKRANATAA